MAREAGPKPTQIRSDFVLILQWRERFFERGNFLVRSVYGAKETFGYTLTNSWVPFLIPW